MSKLIVDLFAGGGGMSVAIEQVFGRSPDVAINHDEDALSMHRANHPHTRHFVSDVFEVDPLTVARDQPVGYLHLSPDCTHHSQASGGQPRSRKIRGLSWVALRWVGRLRKAGRRVDVVSLENVKQILKWGPLVAKRDPATGRVIKLVPTARRTRSGRVKFEKQVAAPGERVPVQQQFLVPDPRREGQTWKRFVRALEAEGFTVRTGMLSAARHGAATTRERLFMMARSDGQPIVFPEPTHFKAPKPGQRKWRAAAEHIDFSLPCPSIFGRKRPLADATLRRIARGVKRFVIDAAEPFIVPVTHAGDERVHGAAEPLRTITTAQRVELAVVAPTLAKFRFDSDGGRLDEPLLPVITSGGHCERDAGAAQTGDPKHAMVAPVLVPRYGEREGQAPRCASAGGPMPTVVPTQNGASLVTAFLAQYNNHRNDEPHTGHDLRDPASTVMSRGCRQALVAGSLVQLNQHCDGRDLADPLQVIKAGGEHHGVVAATLVTNTTHHTGTDLNDPAPTLLSGPHQLLVETRLEPGKADDETRPQPGLSPEHEAGALRVAAFLIAYYSDGGGQGSDPREPAPGLTVRERLALVTVWVQGHPYVIVDIGLRMLTPPELYGCQGFPPSYVINRGHDGRKFSNATQVRMCGNSVSPPPAAALLAANFPDVALRAAA